MHARIVHPLFSARVLVYMQSCRHGCNASLTHSPASGHLHGEAELVRGGGGGGDGGAEDGGGVALEGQVRRVLRAEVALDHLPLFRCVSK